MLQIVLKLKKEGEVLFMLFQITHTCLNELDYLTLSVMKIMAENETKMTENGTIMVENISMLADKNVNKQNFATKQFDWNLNRILNS